MIHAKIVCTIGPASDSSVMLDKLIKAGMNVARLNFSHGSQAEHGARIAAIRQAAEKSKTTVAILMDTKGPEIRIGDLAAEKISLTEGQEITLTGRPVIGQKEIIPVSYRDLAHDVLPGSTILIDDGLIGLEVVSVQGEDIICRVKNAGDILPHKGVNVPGVEVNLPAVTDKDISDINFGIDQQVDFVAASFVRKAADILEIRKILDSRQAKIDIIAKIECRSGVNNVEQILQLADGLMVARGDLGVEIPPEEVPSVQKMIIKKCNHAGKPVITATQMLDSMIRNPRPTRAEASDVYNAILDGTDAIMLSGETAAGHYPEESVQTMVRIARQAESAVDYLRAAKKVPTSATITDAISHASHSIAEELQAAAIITPTASGHTARMVAKYRSRALVIAATQNPGVQRKLNLIWGVKSILVPGTVGTDEMIHEAVATAQSAGWIKAGDLVVVTAGVPVGSPGTTNLIKVHIVGQAVAKGIGVGSRVAAGVARIISSGDESRLKVHKGEIIIALKTVRDYIPALEMAAALVTEDDDLKSLAAMRAIDLGIPVIVGIKNVTELIPDNTVITVDAPRGQIFLGHNQ